MTKQLPMAINLSMESKQHVLENLLNCFTFVDTENKLVIAYPVFLHLGYTKESAQAVLSKPMLLQYTNHKGFVPREDFFISIAQIGELIVNAPEAKYISHVLEFVKNTLMPLFKPAAPQTSPETNKIELNPVKASEPLMMSSQEIANVVKRRHDNVKRTMEMLQNKELISFTQIEENSESKVGRPKTVYHVNKRDSYVVVAQLSPEFTADLVDRWQELENQLAGGVPQISAQPVTTAPALPSAKDLALMVIKSEEEKESLLIDYNFLSKELCQTIREKAQIGSKREASALGKLARANDKLKLRDEKICQLEAKLSSPVSEYEYATILAVQSRLKYIKVSGLKLTYFCNRNGLVIKDIPDDRYGAVHSYPAQAWRDVYQIDINAVLNKVA
ncbi:MAG: Rha family transcriptional regulator [Burkholderiales bacterium]|nr:Rha family transcriptional regulator [Burkholderiales bacterium]